MKLSRIVIFYFFFLIFFFLIYLGNFNKINLVFFFNYMEHIKEQNFIILLFFMMIISIFISFVGFSMPVLLINGSILGEIIGSILSLIALTIGSFIFFLTNKKNISNNIFKKYEYKFSNLQGLINKNLILSLFSIRVLGFGLPFIVHNFVPIFFKASNKVFILSTFFGLIPLTLQSVFAAAIKNYYINEKGQLGALFFQKEIIIIILIFILVFIASYLVKIKYFK
jgi:uncharacterized membrane protein YdjX (TVP38/TMEM64 family)